MPYENVIIEPFENHAQHITGTSISAIMGVSPFKTAFQVWNRIVNNVTDSASTDYAEKKMRAGVKLESAIMNMYIEDTGYEVDYIPKKFGDVTFVSKENPIIGGTPDGIAHIPDGRNIVVEIKNIGYKVSKQFGPTEAPYYYYLQAMLYCWLFECDGVQFAYLVDGYDFKMTDIMPRDNDVISLMLSTANKWWEDYIIGQNPPPPANLKDVLALYPVAVQGKAIEADDDMRDAIRFLKEVKASISELEKTEAEIKDQLAVYMKDSEIMIDPQDPESSVLMTYKTVVTNRFDTRAFQQDYKDLYGQYIRPQSTRRLDLK